MRRWLQTHFGFSYAELRGFYLLCGLATVLWLGGWFWRHTFAPPTGMTAQQAARLDSLMTALARRPEAEQQRSASPRGWQRDSVENVEEKASTVPVHLVDFDPNTATEVQLQGVGIPRFLAQRILRYRAKGGQFRYKEDLARIYDFPQPLFQQLEGYILLPSKAPHAEKRTLASAKPAPKAIQAFDINAADSAMLEALPGIGPYFAKKIVVYRQALGGFVSPAQVFEVFNIDSAAAATVASYGQVQPGFAPRCLNINTASFNTLRSHPYMPPRLARLIEAYRKQHGPYQSVDDLLRIKVAQPADIERLKPYLCL